MHKWIMAVLVSFAGLLLLFLLITDYTDNTGNTHQVVSIPDVPIDERASQEIYKNTCMACHGADMKGAVGPSLVDVGSRLSKEEIYSIINSGKNGMPAFKGQLKDEEIVTVSTWLGSLK